MIFLFFVGVVSFVVGILFLFFPNTLRSMSNKMNKVLVALDEKLYNLRVGVGISLLLVSVLAFFTFYYILKMYIL